MKATRLNISGFSLTELLVESVLIEAESDEVEDGPMIERAAGRRTRPWNRPKVTVRQNTCNQEIRIVYGIATFRGLRNLFCTAL